MYLNAFLFNICSPTAKQLILGLWVVPAGCGEGTSECSGSDRAILSGQNAPGEII